MRSTLKYDIMVLYIVGVNYMKTKIIYISGNEIFEMAEIRAAFDEVRSALGLDKDTILFGVPVDNDNALCQENVSEQTPDSTIEIMPVQDITNETEPSQVQDIESTKPIENTENIINNTVPADSEKDTEQNTEQEKVIPILSVLAGQPIESDAENITDDVSDETDDVIENTSENEPEAIDSTEDIDDSIHAVTTEINITAEIAAPVIDEENVQIEKTTIVNMVEEPAPVASQEKTFEDLLASIKPLREDSVLDTNLETPEIKPIDDSDFLDAEADATLELLASEFAENQDKIVTPQKSQPQGKIGKLKNILPFKKAKRDDNGIMGDLFGWAGIAANDDDFTIPGFFANAAKKQGA